MASASFENEILPILGAEACVLHALRGHESDPTGGGDYDCAVRDLDSMWPLRLAPHWRLLQCLRYDVGGWYWVIERDGDVLKVDTLDDPSGIGQYGFPTELAMTATHQQAEAIHAAYLTAKRLRKGIAGTREWRHIGSLARTDPAQVRGAIEEIFGRSGDPRLAQAVEEGVPPEPSVWQDARRRAWRRRVRTPERATVLAVKSVTRLLGRAVKPTGLVVVLVGPDGTGKSTLAEALPAQCEGPFRRQLHIHWRPGILPGLARIVGATPGDPTDPHGRPPHGRWVSHAALVYYWIDFLLGSWVLTLPTRIRSGLVLIERGWWDIAVDPRRYRMQVSPSVVAILGSLLPRPDLVLVLSAPAETLAERTTELPKEELARQMTAWKRVVPRGVPRANVDASRPIAEVVRRSRDLIFEFLSVRAVRRLGAGWIALPSGRSPRWIFPRGPRTAAGASLSIYEPVTARGRLGWELARLAARSGAFLLLPRAKPPPRPVREALAPHLPARATLAAMRANHRGRHIAAIITEDGRVAAIAKVASDDEGRSKLRVEAEALARFGPSLPPPVRAPKVLAHEDGLLVLETSSWRPRGRPWLLPADVAGACGQLFKRTATGGRGAAHGDLAPWNLLRIDSGWILVDWEDARDDAIPFFDVFHYVVQAHALLGRPSRDEIMSGLTGGSGWVGAAVLAYGTAADIRPDSAVELFPQYLEETLAVLNPYAPDGRRGIAARRALLAVVATGRSTPRT